MGEKSEKRLSMASIKGLDRRSSTRSTNSSSNSNVFGDENAFDAMAVADGFHPHAPKFPRSSSLMPSSSSSSAAPSSSSSASSAAASRLPARTNHQRAALIPSPSSSEGSKKPEAPQPQPQQQQQQQSRRSIMKAPLQALGQRNSFSLRHDASDGVQMRPVAPASEMTQRPLSTLSGLTIPRAQSPFAGASAPSHPYGMYAQDTSHNRSSTVSTITTIRPAEERSYSGPSHPAHPYGMYPQTTQPDAETNALAGSVDIGSVGFSGPQPAVCEEVRAERGRRRRHHRCGRSRRAITAIYALSRRPAGERTLHHLRRHLNPRRLNHRPYSKSHEAPGDSLMAGAARSDSHDADADEAAGEAGEAGEADESAPITSSSSSPTGARERIKAKWTRSKRRTCFGKLPVWVIYLGVFLLIAMAAIVGGAVGRYFGRRAAASANSANYPTPL